MGPLCWPRLHSPCQSALESRPPSPAGPVRALRNMEAICWVGTSRNQASLHSSWSMVVPTGPLGSQTGSVAVGQAQISPWKSAGWRLRMQAFITASNIKNLFPQWYSPWHKPLSWGPSCTHGCVLSGGAEGQMLWVCVRGRSGRTRGRGCSWGLWTSRALAPHQTPDVKAWELPGLGVMPP